MTIAIPLRNSLLAFVCIWPQTWESLPGFSHFDLPMCKKMDSLNKSIKYKTFKGPSREKFSKRGEKLETPGETNSSPTCISL